MLPRDERRWGVRVDTWMAGGSEMGTRSDGSHVSPALEEAELDATKTKPRWWHRLCFLSI